MSHLFLSKEVFCFQQKFNSKIIHNSVFCSFYTILEITCYIHFMVFSPLVMLQSQFCCPCGKMYRLKQLLVRHQRYECGKLPMFSCPYCSKRHTHKHNLNRHIYLVHCKESINVSISWLIFCSLFLILLNLFCSTFYACVTETQACRIYY